MPEVAKSPARPLEGIRALELAEIWAGPFSGALLSDLGAEVVKVEAIQRIARGPTRPKPDDPKARPWNTHGEFNAVSRNKLGITLDLTTPSGADAFKGLVNVSDVVISNYAFGVMDRFGLGYEELRMVRPDVIVLFMPGYGNSGPYRGYRSMGMVLDAVSGHTNMRGYPDLDLSYNSPVHHPDAVAAGNATFAVCLSILRRARTGKGQFIDLSQAESFMTNLGEVFLQYELTGQSRPRRGNRHPAMAPHGVYRCAGEDQWVAIAVRADEEWWEMCEAMQMPQLAHNPSFETLPSRLRNQDELDDIIGRWTRQTSRYHVAQLLQERGVPAGPVLDCGADVYDNPHLQDRDYFQVVDHPDAGTHLLSGQIWKMANRPAVRHGPAPGLGQHNHRILGDLMGISSEALDEMEREQVIGTAPLPGADMGGVRRARAQGAIPPE